MAVAVPDRQRGGNIGEPLVNIPLVGKLCRADVFLGLRVFRHRRQRVGVADDLHVVFLAGEEREKERGQFLML